MWLSTKLAVWQTSLFIFIIIIIIIIIVIIIIIIIIIIIAYVINTVDNTKLSN